MQILKCTAIIALVLVCVPLTADTIRADRDQQAYLSLASQSQYDSVGRLDIKARNGNFLGSGTLIAPDWVITAGHCLDKAKSLTFTVGGASYTADKWVSNPGWKGSLTSGTDIGLLHLSQAVENVTPAAIYSGSDELGQVGTFVGYGMTGTGVTGATVLDGLKRAAQNMVDAYLVNRKKTNTNILLADFDSPTNANESKLGSALPLDLEGLIAPGDSGGGLFIDVDGLTYLAGVHSFGSATDGKVDSDYGDVSGDTRVSAFVSWISSIVGGFSIAADGIVFDIATENSVGAFAVPEPASLALVGLGALGFFVRRRVR